MSQFTEHQDELRRAAAEVQANAEKVVDAANIVFMAMCKMVGMEVRDVPRLAVSAACRGLENMIEHYHRRMDAGLRGGPVMTLEEKVALRRAIVFAANDMIGAMTEGLIIARKIRDSLPSRVPEPKTGDTDGDRAVQGEGGHADAEPGGQGEVGQADRDQGGQTQPE